MLFARAWFLVVVLVGAAGCDGPSITIERMESGLLWEGLGCAPGGCEATCTVAGCPGRRRAPVVYLRTSVPVVSASARIPGVDVPVAVDLLAASVNGTLTAFAVRIPVTAALPAGDRPLELTVVDASGGTASTADDPATALVAAGLDELVLSGPLPALPASGVYRYSSIVVPTAIVAQLGGAEPVRLVATGDMTIAGIVSADASDGGPGPGGCAGQVNASAQQQCPRGGGGGSLTADGGGGSFGSAGAGPLAGELTGNFLSVPVGYDVPTGRPQSVSDDNRGHGGGASADHRGGAGGGAVVLSSFGRISMGQYARVTARGGGPVPASRPSGGGGSGGAIVVSAMAGLDIATAAPRPFEATGGGEAAVRGGDGRIRLDAPGDDLTGFARATPRPWFGPSWLDVPLVVAAQSEVTIGIDPRVPGVTSPVYVMVDDLRDPVLCVPDAGRCRAWLVLSVGQHTLCAVLRPEHGPWPENQACLQVAVVD